MCGYGLDLTSLGWGSLVGCCKHGNEHLGYVKSCVNLLSYYQLVKMNCAP
jgi:hypothetical protein